MHRRTSYVEHPAPICRSAGLIANLLYAGQDHLVDSELSREKRFGAIRWPVLACSWCTVFLGPLPCAQTYVYVYADVKVNVEVPSSTQGSLLPLLPTEGLLDRVESVLQRSKMGRAVQLCTCLQAFGPAGRPGDQLRPDRGGGWANRAGGGISYG